MREYLVPINVVTRFEFFASFGWREMMITLLGIAVGGALFWTLTLAHAPIGARVVVWGMSTATAYLATRRVDGVYSLLDYLRLWRLWSKRPKKYWLW